MVATQISRNMLQYKDDEYMTLFYYVCGTVLQVGGVVQICH